VGNLTRAPSRLLPPGTWSLPLWTPSRLFNTVSGLPRNGENITRSLGTFQSGSPPGPAILNASGVNASRLPASPRPTFATFVAFCKNLSLFPPVQIFGGDPIGLASDAALHYSSSRLAISSIERPVMSGSSLSTVASMISRFFFWRSKIFSSTVPRVISL
jgi:hypothetical protein